MTLSGKEILEAAEYVKQHGTYKEYSIGNVIPLKGPVGYKRYISTKGEKKKDIADYDLI